MKLQAKYVEQLVMKCDRLLCNFVCVASAASAASATVVPINRAMCAMLCISTCGARHFFFAFITSLIRDARQFFCSTPHHNE